MVFAIGPTGVYLILALLFLIVIGGGTYLGYRMSRGRTSRSTKDNGGSEESRP